MVLIGKGMFWGRCWQFFLLFCCSYSYYLIIIFFIFFFRFKHGHGEFNIWINWAVYTLAFIPTFIDSFWSIQFKCFVLDHHDFFRERPFKSYHGGILAKLLIHVLDILSEAVVVLNMTLCNLDNSWSEEPNTILYLIVKHIKLPVCHIFDRNIPVPLQLWGGLDYQLVAMLFLANDDVLAGNEGDFISKSGYNFREGQLDILIEGILEVKWFYLSSWHFYRFILVPVTSFWSLEVLIIGEEDLTMFFLEHYFGVNGKYIISTILFFIILN